MSICDQLWTDAEATRIAIGIFVWLVTACGGSMALIVYAVVMWEGRKLRQQERANRDAYTS